MEDIERNDEASRYELFADGELASIADFDIQDGEVRFTHTETDVAHRGNGFGEKLVLWALEDVRKQGLRPVPHCSFVADVMRTHPEFAA